LYPARFKTNAIAYVRTWDDEDYQKRLHFVEQLKAIPQISGISLGGDPPASGNSNSDVATFFKDGSEINTELQFLFGDANYRKLYGLELLAGRDRLNDTIEEYIVNETYAKILGFTNPVDAVGQMIRRGDSLRQIVGVMPDFHQRALTTDITPMALTGDVNTGFYRQFNTVHLLLDNRASADWPMAIDKVKEAYNTSYADSDFDISFVDDTIAHFYEQERKTSVLLNWSAGLAILISCLGLFGLVIYTTERRIKEIGIRKVMGASVIQLNVLLCREFLVLVGIAFIIAAPVAWWGLHRWLEGYAFRTGLSWWVFVIGALIMLLTSLVIMCARTLHAANANPVNSLRTE
jgi:ABC-type antimicrobial peptide transport system permease subunit